jgi:hypothetical protein
MSLGNRGLWELGGHGAMRDYLVRARTAQGIAQTTREGYVLGVGVTATHSVGTGSDGA